jgi:hypothetical protein
VNHSVADDVRALKRRVVELEEELTIAKIENARLRRQIEALELGEKSAAGLLRENQRLKRDNAVAREMMDFGMSTLDPYEADEHHSLYAAIEDGRTIVEVPDSPEDPNWVRKRMGRDPRK